MNSIDNASINQLILHKQHLTQESKKDDIVQLIKGLCGLQATGTFEPYVYLFCRKNEFKKEELDNQLYNLKNLIKIRAMRNTLFIIPVEYAPMMHTATNYLKENRFDGFFTYTDFTREEYRDLESKIYDILEKDSLIATEIKKRINTSRNISIIISLMCDKLLIVRDRPPKGWKDRRNTYTLMKNNYPNLNFEEIEEQEAINNLVYNYIDAYGPVTEDDIAWWCGLTKTSTRKALESSKIAIRKSRISNSDYCVLPSDLEKLEKLKFPKTPVINLLANLDPYLMGYKNRERFITPDIYEFVFDRSGNATTTILLNGVVIGIWDFETKPKPKVKFLLFNHITDQIINEIKRQAKLIGKFMLEQEVLIQQCTEPLPLTKRSAGTFMRPLKNCS
jgi:hypothetical protein